VRVLRRAAAVERALSAVETRVDMDGGADLPATAGDGLQDAGRVTIAFHPDRLDRRGRTTAEGLAADGAYLPQWLTGASSGSRSAVPGGLRAAWERDQFAVDDDVALEHRPIYGALDLLHHRHGGSPAFGSCFLVLRDQVRARCTLSVGDSHLGPGDVGTFQRPEAVLRGLATQALAGQLLGQGLGRDALLDVLGGVRVPALRRTLDHYVEVQVHGGVTLDDIAAIHVDPSFASSDVADHLRRAADAAGAAVHEHPGTTVDAQDIATHPAARAFVGDDGYLAALVEELERLTEGAAADAAAIGRLVAGARPGPPRPGGDHPRGPLQRVKHHWRLTYLLGVDAVAWGTAAT
jgi:hypothetical protein